MTKIIHMTSSSGHRGDYQSVLGVLFGLKPSLGRVTSANLPSLCKSEALMFGSIDDDQPGFLRTALHRAMRGKRTVGLFLRPQSCFTGNLLKAWIKRILFNALRRSNYISVCTIVPFEVAPEYREVAKEGLSDPQIWDRMLVPFDPSTEFVDTLRERARGRRILAFIGSPSWFKSPDKLLDLMQQDGWDEAGICVVVVGKVAEESRALVQRLEASGAVVYARFISNEELDAVYEVADFIWACYHPDYDQASGNFGRALQAGKIPIVREGTLIESIAADIGHPVIAIDHEAPLNNLPRRLEQASLNDAPPTDWIKAQMKHFVTAVERAL